MLLLFYKNLHLISVLLFLIIFIIFVIISIILNYHWVKYGINPQKINFLKKLYFSVSFLLLITMFTALIFILKGDK
jgi:uncharacterized membrane protein YedE/YeeE